MSYLSRSQWIIAGFTGFLAVILLFGGMFSFVSNTKQIDLNSGEKLGEHTVKFDSEGSGNFPSDEFLSRYGTNSLDNSQDNIPRKAFKVINNSAWKGSCTVDARFSDDSFVVDVTASGSLGDRDGLVCNAQKITSINCDAGSFDWEYSNEKCKNDFKADALGLNADGFSVTYNLEAEQTNIDGGDGDSVNDAKNVFEKILLFIKSLIGFGGR